MKHAFRERVKAELHVKNLTRAAKDIAFVLSGYPSHSFCWPSHATIAARAECSVRTVQRALDRLKMLGLVDWTHRYRPGRGRGHRTSNTYRLAVPVEAVRALRPVKQIDDDVRDFPAEHQRGRGQEYEGDQSEHANLLTHTGHNARQMEIYLGSKRPTRAAGWHPRPQPHPPQRSVAEMLAILAGWEREKVGGQPQAPVRTVEEQLAALEFGPRLPKPPRPGARTNPPLPNLQSVQSVLRSPAGSR